MGARQRFVFRRGVAGAIVLVFMGMACGGGAESPGGTSTTPPGAPKSIPELKLAVLDAVGGRLSYCDPDLYPVAHGDPVSNAQERLPVIEADRDAFEAILEHRQLTAGQSLSPDQLVAISEDYKQMQAIELQPAGEVYRFSLLVPKEGSESVERTSGTVTRSGSVDVEIREPGHRPSCPICLAEGVLISTPSGEIAVQDIRTGMPVWTTDGRGRRIVGAVLQVGHTAAPPGHQMIRLVLADGRAVSVSPGHPTADGRSIRDLLPGDRYDGSRVAATTPVPYPAEATYDLLPSGPTGTYFANGVLLGSTLDPDMTP